jgi:hypothetical protein
VNTKRVNGAAGVILAALQQNRTAAGIALALESAGLLMTPETAAEMKQLQDDVTGACLARWEEEQENARLRRAWQSARERAQAHSEGTLRHVADRDFWKGQCQEAQAEAEKLRAQVAALLEERHRTNEALSDAAEALRADRDRIAELEAERADAVDVSETLYRALHDEMLAGSALYAALTMPTTPEQRQAALDRFTAVAQRHGQKHAPSEPDGITRRIAPTQALREDAYVSPLHHDYRLGRDLPQPGATP